MSLNDVIESVRARALIYGQFQLLPGEFINTAVSEKQVPNNPGVYLIFNSANLECPVYIGKAGTMNRDGTWRSQGIKGRLTAVQGKMPRSRFFNARMKETYGKGLTFHWFVTHDRKAGVIPAFAEMDLLRAYYEQFEGLPELNECI
jgi:hypothetical protein